MRVTRRENEAGGAAEAHDPSLAFRRDLERIRFSPYYSRLSAVTQVIGQSGAGPLVHNRLTHSLKVTAVARSIAVQVEKMLATTPAPLTEEYVCDPVVVQAAASAHDLGHPPFGHVGEGVLDRLARETLGLEDGFEGNAQTYRIVATLDVCAGPTQGLNLTAASRAAVAKYPWTPAVTSTADHDRHLPPGLRTDGGELIVRKYSAYFLEADDLATARESSRGVIELQQSLEASVMDIADDIAYSIHDIDDFHRAGLLSHGAIAREFREWIEHSSEFRALDDGELMLPRARPGSALEALRRKLGRDDAWISDDETFPAAVNNIAGELVDGLLFEAYDGSIASERALASFTNRWIHHFQNSVELAPSDNPRTGLVTLNRRAWHEVEVLKFVHRHFVLNRSDIAMHQRGLSRLLVRAVKGLVAWLEDPHDASRVPPRLQELVDIATDGYAQLRRTRPEGVPVASASDERRLGRGRGVLDYVASLSDEQAIAVSEAIDGRPDRLWNIGEGL